MEKKIKVIDMFNDSIFIFVVSTSALILAI